MPQKKNRSHYHFSPRFPIPIIYIGDLAHHLPQKFFNKKVKAPTNWANTPSLFGKKSYLCISKIMKRLLYILCFVLLFTLFSGSEVQSSMEKSEQTSLILSEAIPTADLFRAGDSTISLPTSEGSVTQQRTSQSTARRVNNSLLSRKSIVASSYSSSNLAFVRSVIPVPAGDIATTDYYVYRLRHIII